MRKSATTDCDVRSKLVGEALRWCKLQRFDVLLLDFGRHTASRQPPEHDSDYDGAWKEALRLYLRRFIEKYFPAEHAVINWSFGQRVVTLVVLAQLVKVLGGAPGEHQEIVGNLPSDRLD